MNSVFSKASQSDPRAGENCFDLVSGREPPNAVKDIGGSLFGQHSRISRRDAANRVSPRHGTGAPRAKKGQAPSLRICRAHANISEPRRARTMPGAHDLLRLALAAIWSSPQRPFIARAD